jgi:formylglycine-generating enzyme required for sulfatase activity
MSRLFSACILLTSLVFLGSHPLVELAQADVFGNGPRTFDVEFVPISEPGNAADDAQLSPVGAVDYSYRMAKYEISERMVRAANDLGNLGITLDQRGPDKPATNISWYEAARFTNWLNTSSGRAPAYKFDLNGAFQVWEPGDVGYDATNLYRNRRARYFLPSIDEWHKAAYYDRAGDVWYDYPTGSNDVPDGIDFVGDTEFDAVFFDGAANDGPNDVTDVGLLSPFGTAGQGGNVFEWHETAFDRTEIFAGAQRSEEGGAWDSPVNVLLGSHTGIGTTPLLEIERIGFRVASVPEPSTLILVALAFLVSHQCGRIRR